jgi:hypothetical protein
MNKSDLIIEQAMANLIATVNMLEEGIKRENDEKRINDLKIRRDLLIDVLTELRVDYGSKNKDQDRVA